jgi:hypothetical protein
MDQTQTSAGTGRGGRPPVEPVDLDRSRRPGVPKERRPEPWPNSRPEPARMRAPPSVPRHGRPGKPMPPVYGTAVPLRGLSGAVRRAAYRLPDHTVNHWLLLLLGDRVQSWELRARRGLLVVAPLAAVALLWRRAVRA